MNLTWDHILKYIVASLPILAVLWKGIDSYFAYQSKKDKDLIEQVVKQVVNGPLTEMQNDIKDMRKSRDQDISKIHDRIDKIFTEIKK